MLHACDELPTRPTGKLQGLSARVALRASGSLRYCSAVDMYEHAGPAEPSPVNPIGHVRPGTRSAWAARGHMTSREAFLPGLGRQQGDLQLALLSALSQPFCSSEPAASIAYTTSASVHHPSRPFSRMTTVASKWLKEPRTVTCLSAGFSGGARVQDVASDSTELV